MHVSQFDHEHMASHSAPSRLSLPTRCSVANNCAIRSIDRRIDCVARRYVSLQRPENRAPPNAAMAIVFPGQCWVMNHFCSRRH